MNILAEINKLKERVQVLENHHKPKEKADVSIDSMDNKDVSNGSDVKANTTSSRRLSSSKLKKQTRRQAVGTSKKGTRKKVSAKAKSKDK
jgi:hypothetical protein